MSEGTPNAEEVRAALETVLAWPGMARSPQLGQFLRYIVERTLSGEPHAIKAYSIAVDVLGRPADFDPQADPIVRVQARRLRALLDGYYQDAGAADPIRIVLPTGRYVPEFVRPQALMPLQLPTAPAGPVQVRPIRRGRGWIATLAVLVIVAIVGLGAVVLLQDIASRLPPGGRNLDRLETPRVNVEDFRSLVDADVHGALAGGLAVELITDLEQFGTIDVRYQQDPATPGAVLAEADFVLGGSVTELSGRWQYQATLTEATTGRMVWSKTIEMLQTTAARGNLLDEVSGRLSRVLGSPRGPIHARARALFDDGAAIVGRESIYLCRMLFDLFREREPISEGLRTAFCIDSLPPDEQGNGTVLAIRAGLALAAVPGRDGAVDATSAAAAARAEALLDQAVLVAPTNAFVWEQRARLAEVTGRHRMAQEAYGAALQLNPANMDALAAHARHLALVGQLNRAVPLAGQAIDGAPEPPPWYLAVPTLAALDEGRFPNAMSLAVRYAEADRELGPVLAIAAARGAGDLELASRYVNRIVEAPANGAQRLIERLRLRIEDQDLLETLLDALEWAGLPAASPQVPG